MSLEEHLAVLMDVLCE